MRHENQLFRVPDDMPDEVAVLMEPAAVGLHAVLREPPAPNAKLLVIGAGTIGLALVAALRAVRIDGLDVTVVARHAYRPTKRSGSARTASCRPPSRATASTSCTIASPARPRSATRSAALRPRGTLILVGSNGRRPPSTSRRCGSAS